MTQAEIRESFENHRAALLNGMAETKALNDRLPYVPGVGRMGGDDKVGHYALPWALERASRKVRAVEALDLDTPVGLEQAERSTRAAYEQLQDQVRIAKLVCFDAVLDTAVQWQRSPFNRPWIRSLAGLQ